ncbi:hypothetical protein ACFP2T_43695 [Plantactinospora solaniradicis]|uniref:Glycosyltransferase RgtA/B/C/D-like domain-containing protein n=1 Tax=Plantactinospora solaniradicis TaxID=1723736 RepID=A0ABW1KQA3_9ACTN
MSVAMPRGGRLVRSLDRPALVALGLGLLGVGYRLALILLTVPGSNSDEATFGLAALHIAQGRELPVFLYGQHYMGTVESYLAAPLFVLFGPGWSLLRLPLLFLYAAFVYLTYRLTRHLYSPWLATFTVGLLALGSERVVRDQITAVGGRPEIKPAVVGLLLIALALGQRRIRRRWLAFGFLGVISGLCVWDDWLVLPYLITAFGVLLFGCWRELFGRAGAVLVGGFLLGVAPLIVDNLTAPPGQDSVSVLMQVSEGDAVVTSAADRVHGAVLLGVPLATGLCPPERCQPWQMWWGWLYLALLLVAVVLAVRGLLRRGQRTDAGAGRSPGTERIRYVTHLALLVAAALTLAAYGRSALAATQPLASARYLSILQISLPAVLWPLWLVARWAGRVSAKPLARTSGVLAATVLSLLVAFLLGATAQLIGEIPTIRTEERQFRELATTLRRAGLRQVYGEYWTCNRLVFNSRERVNCAVLGDNLRPGQNRYPPYPERVRAAARPAFVFAVGGPAEAAFQALLRRRAATATVTEIGTYRIYQPSTPIQPPG